MVFFASTLYQFGAVTEVQFEWFEYTLTTMHAVAVSLIVYLVAFASSETRNFDAYDGWEKALIAAGPSLIALHQWYDPVNEWIMTTSEPWMQIAAAAVVLIGYGVAVQ